MLQFDWSEDWAHVGGEHIKLQVAHIKLSHSRAFLVRAYLLQTQDLSLMLIEDEGSVSVFKTGFGDMAVFPVQGTLAEVECGNPAAGQERPPLEVFTDLITLGLVAEALCNLLLHPRIAHKGQPLAKDRERARWKLGASRVPAAWHQVSWTLGKPVAAKSDASEPGYRMPLHYTRAHLRRAEEHHPRARRVKGREGWWTLVRGHWRGHPDFGIKLHHYSPRLGRGDPGYRSGKEPAADSRIATGGAIAAALDQAEA